MHDPVLTLSVSEFKAKCLSLFDDLADHKVAKVVVTRHGKPVAELSPPAVALPPIHGAHPGSVIIRPGVDLTRLTFEEDEFDLEAGL